LYNIHEDGIILGREGDFVEAGNPIGIVGITGNNLKINLTLLVYYLDRQKVKDESKINIRQ